ncbi:hypothetical protein Scep_017421 [Stephania cephalantha]|uniref:Uncharacterized protein n=1 Tax=Stephania cephalantha TaxID=152367 RepID=A0AAP0IQW1_9MAGN
MATLERSDGLALTERFRGFARSTHRRRDLLHSPSAVSGDGCRLTLSHHCFCSRESIFVRGAHGNLEKRDFGGLKVKGLHQACFAHAKRLC